MTNAELYETAVQDKSRNKPKSVTCPVCKTDSPACHWEEADTQTPLGVGTQVGDVRWVCLEHGIFDLDLVFRDQRFSA